MKLGAALAAHPRRVSVALVGAAFVASRAIAWSGGVRLSDEELGSFWHFIEPELLETRLLPSLWALHGQPPGFNLLLGIGLKLFGDGAHLFWAGLFFGLGALSALLVLLIMLELDVPRRLATFLACAWALSPVAILYENVLLYTHLAMALLLATVWSLLRAERSGAARWWLVALASGALLVLTRSLFHPLWLTALLAGAVGLTRRRRRAVLLAGALPLVLVAALSLKQLAQFGTLTTSSWAGMSWARITTFQLDASTRRRLVERGELSPLAMVRPFAPLDSYAAGVPLPEPTGEPLLDRPRKWSGAVNLHHLAYVEISRRYAADARRVLATHPEAYARGLLRAGRRFLSPASEYPPLATNRRVIGPWVAAHDSLVHFAWPGLGPVGWLPLAVPGLALFALVIGLGRWRAGASTGLGLVLIGAIVIWVAVVSCAVEVGENNRFRFLVDPLVVILAGCAGSAAWRRWRRWRRQLR